MHFKRLALGLAALVLTAFGHVVPSHAAVSFNVGVCDPKTTANCIKPNSDGSINIVGSISASSPFKVLGNATLPMTTASARVALPTADTTVFIYNGSTTSNAFVKLGNTSVTAAATDQVIAPGSFIALSNAAGNADIAGILASGTGTLYVSTGTGSPFAAGGGGGSGGGGGAVTAAAASYATGFSSDIGTLASSSVCSTDTGACDLLGLVKRTNARLTTLNTTLGSPFQASASIGNTAFASTATGVSACANAISAGAGRALVLNLFSALCIVNTDPTTGAPLDPAAPINCGPTATFVQCPTFAVQALQATAAKQPALGVAGTPSADVISVQGVSGGAPQLVSISQTTPGTTNAVAIKDTNNVAPDFTATVPTGQVGPYPGKNTAGVFSSATPETCSSGNVANATVACTLATASTKTTYISGFAMTADGATVGLAVSCTLTGTITGTMTFTFAYPAGVAVAGTPLVVQFSPAIPASTTNTTIVASCPASGTGGTNAAMNAWGFQL